ncbi:MAG: hypothetical protein EOM79_00885 [Epsilonproteobacteria bacterium]|jgi:hypothetical protein|nr:hypothetical protein [Bacilli bacterium]MDD4303156.1 hypothetical protein [Bacilli bacterium]NCA94630.1 hypothetical protein [Campylobacterota bacterium]NLB40574.1 hypothetical protein [Erysipelotrichaceae bacterium]HNY75076.1 hypothetical protein [Bacilli bacterium]
MPELVIKTLLAIAVLAVLVGLFILGYLLNKKVPRPEGCDLEKTDQCSQCAISTCRLNQNHDKDKGD